MTMKCRIFTRWLSVLLASTLALSACHTETSYEPMPTGHPDAYVQPTLTNSGRALPAIDAAAPDAFETATFALG